MGAQEGDILRNGYLIEDISLTQLSECFDGKLLAQNLIGDRNFEFYSKTNAFSENTNDWYSLLYSEYNTDSKIIMHCMFGEKAEDWKIDMVFTDEATKVLDINGVNVEIAKFDLSLQYNFCYYALFDYDGVVYDLRVYSDDENMITDILEKLIR
ncbi:MAG: hypothetical protein IKL10_05330 [Clostridia bacterium]|nr:hypothetical protein [Clostridia bacterium]